MCNIVSRVNIVRYVCTYMLMKSTILWTSSPLTYIYAYLFLFRKSCSLFIQTDPLIWNHIWKQERARLTNKPVEEVDAKEINVNTFMRK